MTELNTQQAKTLRVLEVTTGMKWRLMPMDARQSPGDIPSFLVANMPVFSGSENGEAVMKPVYTHPHQINRDAGSHDYMYAMCFDDTTPPREGKPLIKTIATVRDIMVSSGVLHKGDMQAIHYLDKDGYPHLTPDPEDASRSTMNMHGIALPSTVGEDPAFLEGMAKHARERIGAEVISKQKEATKNTERAACEALKKATGLSCAVLDRTALIHTDMKFAFAGVPNIYANQQHEVQFNGTITDTSNIKDNRFYMLDITRQPERLPALIAALAQVNNLIKQLGWENKYEIYGGFEPEAICKLMQGDTKAPMQYGCILLPASMVETPEFQRKLGMDTRLNVLKTELNIPSQQRGLN